MRRSSVASVFVESSGSPVPVPPGLSSDPSTTSAGEDRRERLLDDVALDERRDRTVPRRLRPWVRRQLCLDGWTTVRWARWLFAGAQRTLTPRDVFVALAAWTLTSTLALGSIAFLVDGGLLFAGRQPAGYALYGASIAAALSFFCAVLVAPVFAVASGLTASIRLQRRWHWLWCAPIALASERLASHVVETTQSGHINGSVLVVAFTGCCTVGALLAQARHRLGPVATALIGGSALIWDVATPRPMYRDLHDLAALVAVGATLLWTMPVHRRLRRATPRRLAMLVGAVAVAAIGVCALADHVLPGWRTACWRHARFQPGLARLLRGTIDLDGDGFSPVAWGGDCSDLDPRRNPLAREGDVGRDLNCNGFALPARSSDSDRGLAPAAGNPDAPAGSVDLALLITVDCLTLDAFDPAVMPRLHEYAQRGITFDRLYAAGSRTHVSLPLIQRSFDGQPTVAEQLAPAHVDSTAILGYFDNELAPTVKGYRLRTPQTFEQPFHPELASAPLRPRHSAGAADATALTNEAIQLLRSTSSTKQLVWLHYFDAHWPYSPRPEAERIAGPPGAPPDFGRHLTEAHHIDSEIGRLLDELSRSGKLDRAVVIVTADHGEGFNRHGVRYHGVSGYEMLIHVPGVMLAPGVTPGHYDGLVSHRDIPPTLLGAFSQAAKHPTGETFGRSWLRLAGARNAPLHRFVVARSSRAVDVTGFVIPIAAIVDGSRKLIYTFEDGLSEAYDVVRDPAETVELVPDASLERLHRELELYRDLDHYP